MPKETFFPPWPEFGETEVRAVQQCLLAGGTGEVESFEQEFGQLCGVPYAIATNSGSTALELALRALGIEPGDEVIVPARGYFATAAAVSLCGGRPVFCDVGLESQNLDVQLLAALLSKKTRAVICIHLAGVPCDMAELTAFTTANQLFLVEDCAQAHGAVFGGMPVGSFGDAAIFSFTGDKILSTQEGGMLVTNSRGVWERAWSYRENGKRFRPGGRGSEYLYLRDRLGSNFRMPAVSAALGRSQLHNLHDWVVQRRSNAAVIQRALESLSGFHVQAVPEGAEASFYQCNVRVDTSEAATQILERARDVGAPISRGACPEVYREPVFQHAGLAPDRPLIRAKNLAKTNLAVDVNPRLQTSEMQKIVQVLVG